jgi:hypothetical protein
LSAPKNADSLVGTATLRGDCGAVYRPGSNAGLAFALKFEGRKRWHDAHAFMADIVAKRLVRYLERAGYVVMKRPPLGGHSAVSRGFKG